MRAWLNDLGMGIRLAVGGSRATRTGIVRLLMGTIGIGIAVFVLLVAVSAPGAASNHTARSRASFPNSQPITGVAPTKIVYGDTYFRDESVTGLYVHPTGANSPVPPGVDHFPAPDEVMVSPALAQLLASPDGALLHDRFPQPKVTVIDRGAVSDQLELTYYSDGVFTDADEGSVQQAYSFGRAASDSQDLGMATVIAVGTVALLVPVLVFVSISSRIAGAERDRRLAALRLVGASRRQTVRIAAAESLAGAGTGLVLGVGVFVLFRSMVERMSFMQAAFYTEDISPPWYAVLLVLLLVPGIAVGTALFSMRHTVIEPLGVVRQASRSRRRLWWRLIAPVLGVALLLLSGREASLGLAAGASLLLVGIPMLLPWLLERGLGRFRGGSPAVQLAVRRLQLETGTAARVVSGLAVVLAGAVAMQSVLSAEADHKQASFGAPTADSAAPQVLNINPQDDNTDQALTLVRGVAGVRQAWQVASFSVQTAGNQYYSVSIADCSAIRQLLVVDHCANGDAFTPPPPRRAYHANAAQVADGTVSKTTDATNGTQVETRWRVPARVRPAAWSPLLDGTSAQQELFSELIVTPAAVAGLDVDTYTDITAVVDPTAPDLQDRLRNALAPLQWRVYVQRPASDWMNADQKAFATVRNGLLGGSLFTLLLAGISLLVVALEQMRERRRAIAALAATGVPTRTLARSVLLQTAIPMGVGALVAVLTGLGLSALVFPLLDQPFSVDWGAVAFLSTSVALLVVLVTGLTLPSLRGAARLDALRSE